MLTRSLITMYLVQRHTKAALAVISHPIGWLVMMEAACGCRECAQIGWQGLSFIKDAVQMRKFCSQRFNLEFFNIITYLLLNSDCGIGCV